MYLRITKKNIFENLVLLSKWAQKAVTNYGF